MVVASGVVDIMPERVVVDILGVVVVVASGVVNITFERVVVDA